MKRVSRLALLGAAVVGGVALVLAGTTAREAPAGLEERKAAVVRPAAVAGMFYPAGAGELRGAVERHLAEAEGAGEEGAGLVALIAPHAGYVFSGPVAGYAYGALEGRRYDAVVVVGPSHRVGFAGAALSGADEWETPLGRVAVDRAGCDAIAGGYEGACVLEGAHESEHSIEVQLPFLQVALGEFELVPVMVADSSLGNCEGLAEAIAGWARGRSVLLVASTDMSHYPSYGDAVRVDGEMLEAVETMEAERVGARARELMAEGVRGLSTCLCGEGAVKTVLLAARLLGADRAKVLRYANSGDVAEGGRDRVVGYCAVGLYGPGGKLREEERVSESKGELDAGQQARLLAVARRAIEGYVGNGKMIAVEESDPALVRPGAAFVTLRKRGGLRGCIGSLRAEEPLVETVRNRAVDAACRDPRFPRVSREELGELEVEVSVLSPLRRVESAEEIDIRKHGVMVVSGGRSGVFLPQVAAETGWSREELLSHLCRDKAGLAADAWRKGAELHVFTVQAFSSPAPGEGGHGGG